MRTLRYPEFTVPASMVIFAGVLVAALLFLLEHNGLYWAISVYLIVTGICLARRNWFGTGLLVVGLSGLLLNKIVGYFEHEMDWTLYSVVKDLLGFLIFASMVFTVIMQVRYFRFRAGEANPNPEGAL